MDDINDITDILNPNNSNKPIGRLPDLTLKEISSYPGNPHSGQTVKVSVKVCNSGRKRLRESKISMTIGYDQVSSVSVPQLEGGEYFTITFNDPLALPSGINVIKLLADPLNEMKEGNEKNNALATTIIVGEPQNRSIFNWTYEGTDWKLDFGSPAYDLEGLGEDRIIFSYEKYLAYVKPDDRTIRALAEILKFYSQNAGYESYDEVSFVLGFVQEMPYTSDEETKGDNYPRYPIETIVDGGGDCEDTSALFASIIGNSDYFNYESALIIIDEHMAVGVTGEEGIDGTYFPKGDRRYYYCETTGKGYAIGEVPDAYTGAEIKELIEIS